MTVLRYFGWRNRRKIKGHKTPDFGKAYDKGMLTRQKNRSKRKSKRKSN